MTLDEIRHLALDWAMQTVGHTADPDHVVAAARKYEDYLVNGAEKERPLPEGWAVRGKPPEPHADPALRPGLNRQ